MSTALYGLSRVVRAVVYDIVGDVEPDCVCVCVYVYVFGLGDDDDIKRRDPSAGPHQRRGRSEPVYARGASGVSKHGRSQRQRPRRPRSSFRCRCRWRWSTGEENYSHAVSGRRRPVCVSLHGLSADVHRQDHYHRDRDRVGLFPHRPRPRPRRPRPWARTLRANRTRHRRRRPDLSMAV